MIVFSNYGQYKSFVYYCKWAKLLKENVEYLEELDMEPWLLECIKEDAIFSRGVPAGDANRRPCDTRKTRKQYKKWYVIDVNSNLWYRIVMLHWLMCIRQTQFGFCDVIAHAFFVRGMTYLCIITFSAVYWIKNSFPLSAVSEHIGISRVLTDKKEKLDNWNHSQKSAVHTIN